jgi:cyclophilin family peptidyl-prolyl cis-trans isomerase
LPHAARQWRLFAAALALFFSIVVVGQQRQIASLREELDITNQHRSHLEQTRSNLLSQLYAREQSLEGYKRTHGIMTKANQDMSAVIAKLEKQAAEGVREISELREEGKEDRRNARRWEAYEQGVRERSRASVVEKYGDGPHNVELQLRFPSSDAVETVRIELASPDEMPQTLDAFLTQVSTGSWDGSAFDLHAGHVLMARSSSPASASQSGSASTLPEYSARHPHDKYTVAFPSSSAMDFYVNLRSNDAHHSPRVETDEDGNESFVEGEPCFGRIVDAASRRAVDRMDALMAEGRGGSVTIVSARIVAGR